MRVTRVIEARAWVNSRTGLRVSAYGAAPYASATEKAEWSLQVVGWTWENSNGTVGLCRPPSKTREEAEEVMRKVNAR